MRIGTMAIVGVLLVALLGLSWAVAPHADPPADDSLAAPSTAGPTLVPDLIYGRVTTITGVAYEGRLRWNRVEEATWDDEFNGYKETNPWADFVPALRDEKARAVTLFGFRLGSRDRAGRLARPYVARFGTISRIDVGVRTITVTTRNGHTTTLRRSSASDVDDGLRVWTGDGTTVDLDSSVLARIDFQATPPLARAPARLWGTVHTADATFTGFLAWNRDDALSTDTLDGRTADGTRRIPYARIKAMVRRGDDRLAATLSDGSTVILGGTPDSGADNRGVQVDDARFGRVHVPWRVFQQVDFGDPPTHHGNDDFEGGQALAATVSTSDGATVNGRLVFDLDESETTDLLDGPGQGLDYSIPFSRIASIEPHQAQPDGDHRVAVRLRGGLTVVLDAAGDVSDRNPGILVFTSEDAPPTYVEWRAVATITFP